MESKVGSVLLMISAIITLLISIGIVVLSILVFSGVIGGERSVALRGTLLLVIGVILLIFALLKFWASGLMKNPATTSKGGIVALIVGIINGGDLLSVIGGILGIVQGGKH